MVSVHKKMKELARLLMAIDNLYERCVNMGIINSISRTEDTGNKKNTRQTVNEKETDTYKYKCQEAAKKLVKIRQYAEGYRHILMAAQRAKINSHNK